MGRAVRHQLQSLTIPLLFFAICHTVQALPIIATRKSEDLLCSPATGWDVIQFFALNYFAHAFTVKSVPGASARISIGLAVGALLLPYSGVVRACRAITLAKYGDNELEHAQRVGALCMVRAKAGMSASFTLFQPDSGHHVVQGQISGNWSADKYGLQLVPRDWPLVPLQSDTEMSERPGDATADENHDTDESKQSLLRKAYTDNIHVANTNTTVKSVIAIGQLIYASFTLYKTAGPQTERWGYAAFGLTVLPYAVMSLVNLVATALSPDFPALTLVRNKDMDEAEKAGVHFAGVVAMVARDFDPVNKSKRPDWKEYSSGWRRTTPALVLAIFALIAPYVIVAILTKFKPANSTSVERGLLMTWLVGGQVIGAVVGLMSELLTKDEDAESYLGRMLILGFFSFIGIAGMVIVGKQLVAYGNCIEHP